MLTPTWSRITLEGEWIPSELFIPSTMPLAKDLTCPANQPAAPLIPFQMPWTMLEPIEATWPGRLARPLTTALNILRAELDDEIVKSANSRANELIKAGKLSETAEISYWEKIAKACDKGTDAYKTAMAKVQQAKNDLNTDITKLTKTYSDGVDKAWKDLDTKIAEFKKTYNEAVTKRQDEITSSINLFDTVNKDAGVAKNDLTNNLQQQVNDLSQWNTTLNNLENRLGSSNPLYQELSKMGVSSLETLKNVNSMSDEELNHYVDLYKQKQAIALQRSTEENAASLRPRCKSS
jgi:hypothetical protein